MLQRPFGPLEPRVTAAGHWDHGEHMHPTRDVYFIRVSALLADEAQVVGRFEVGNPVVEKTDTVRLAKAIQFVEPDRPLAQPLSEVLEEELEPTWRVQLDDTCRLGPRVPHSMGDPARFQHPAAWCRLDDLLGDPNVHFPLEHVEPDIVLMHVWR